jgi:hypothetical protein
VPVVIGKRKAHRRTLPHDPHAGDAVALLAKN